MCASAYKRRTLVRPNAQNLSLSLVEHPSFPFRTLGLGTLKDKSSPFSPCSDNMALMSTCSHFNPKSVPPFKLGDLTPLSALTTCSVYSQDSWAEQDQDSPQLVIPVHYPVDTRRFAVALSPNTDFILPFASAPVSAITDTFVPNVDEPIDEVPMRMQLSEEFPEVSKTSPANIMAASKTTIVKLARLAKATAPLPRLMTKRKTSVVNLCRLLPCVPLSIPSSQHRRHTANQVPPYQKKDLNEHPINPSLTDSNLVPVAVISRENNIMNEGQYVAVLDASDEAADVDSNASKPRAIVRL